MSKKDETKFREWYENTWIPTLKPELHNSAKALLNDESASQELMNGFLRQDDYTKKTTELAQTRAELEAYNAAVIQKENAYLQWYGQASQQFAEQGTKLKSLETALANTGFTQGQPKVETTPEQKELLGIIAGLHNRIEQIDKGTYNATVNLSSLAYKAAKEGYSFDPARVVEISTTQNLPLDRAFNEFIAPEREARQKVQAEKDRENLRDEIRREMLSNRPGPDNFGSENPVVERLFKADAAPLNRYDRVAEATKEFFDTYKGD